MRVYGARADIENSGDILAATAIEEFFVHFQFTTGQASQFVMEVVINRSLALGHGFIDAVQQILKQLCRLIG